MFHSLGRGRISHLFAIVPFVALLNACTPQKMATSHGAKSDDGKSEQEVIYGDDNRTDFYDETDLSLRNLSESTVALMSPGQLDSETNGLRKVVGTNYGTSLGLCSDERFVEQDTAAFCSGFLVSPDTIVTAGHCVTDLKGCMETSYVFGFAVRAQGVLPTSIPAQDVYSCKSLVHTQSPSKGADFAIVKLDRPVKNHLPLLLRSVGTIAQKSDVTVIGYPEGLPLKIASGARVRDTSSPGFFVANLDTYGGNSGSAVVNTLTHEVEGVLVRGEQDFDWSSKDGCSRSYRCKDDACRGEDVTRISEVQKFL